MAGDSPPARPRPLAPASLSQSLAPGRAAGPSVRVTIERGRRRRIGSPLYRVKRDQNSEKPSPGAGCAHRASPGARPRARPARRPLRAGARAPAPPASRLRSMGEKRAPRPRARCAGPARAPAHSTGAAGAACPGRRSSSSQPRGGVSDWRATRTTRRRGRCPRAACRAKRCAHGRVEREGRDGNRAATEARALSVCIPRCATLTHALKVPPASRRKVAIGGANRT